MPTNSDPYFTSRPELSHPIFHKVSTWSDRDPPPLEYPEAGVETAAPANKKKLLYHVNKVTRVYSLCIPPSVATEIITLAHGAGHLRFS